MRPFPKDGPLTAGFAFELTVGFAFELTAGFAFEPTATLLTAALLTATVGWADSAEALTARWWRRTLMRTRTVVRREPVTTTRRWTLPTLRSTTLEPRESVRTPTVNSLRPLVWT